ncbi:response regulator transcription factor [Streptococcus hongkongensis]|nr:transcriptional regulator [Streptococcus uberis]
MFHILVAEDDISLNKIITTKLKQANFQVFSASNGQEVLDILDQQQIDLLITDIMMPVMDGYTCVKLLREADYTLPILMMTAKSQFESLEEAFKVGVDDYLVKPIRLQELVLRVQALLRRAQLEANHVLNFAHTRLDYQDLTVTNLDTGAIEQVPMKEFYVLYKLLSRPEKIFTRLDLLDDIWGMGDDKDERLVDACIKRIRQKFKGNSDFEIVTIRGLGYKGKVIHEKN